MAVTRETVLKPLQCKSMEVERIYPHELDSEPEMLARKQHHFESRLASHEESISSLLDNLEKMQSELPQLKAMIIRQAASTIQTQEGLGTHRELRLWALPDWRSISGLQPRINSS
jgi:septal ring factor EnvC (AmiA/AmiB activator)